MRVFYHKLKTRPSLVRSVSRLNIPTITRFVVFAGFNVLFGYNRIKYTTDYKLYGWLTLANGGLALLLSARTNIFSLVLRIPSPVLLCYHRLIGRATLVHATLHFAITANHHSRTHQLGVVLDNRQIQAGLVAWASLCVIALTSAGPIRRRFFEAFYYSHAFFLVFVAAALVHAFAAPEFLLPGLCLWVVDRIVRFANNFRQLSVRSVTHYAGDVTKIKVQGIKPAHPGQIAFLQVTGISFFNWHPFTIASAPQDDSATFAIRGLGGFTKKVQQVADAGKTDLATEMPMRAGSGGIHNHIDVADTVTTMTMRNVDLKLRLDGPYGTGSLHYSRYPVVVLVAGGIGITPGISIASHIAHRATSGDLPAHIRWHVHLLWVVKDVRHAAWFEEELAGVEAMTLQSGGRATVDVTIYATGKNRPEASAPSQSCDESSFAMEEPYTYTGPGTVIHGRPDLTQWFETIRCRHRGLDAAVNLCGPPRLIYDARSAAAHASGSDGLFHVEEEVFEF
jgi:predicted ferric reductase